MGKRRPLSMGRGIPAAEGPLRPTFQNLKRHLDHPMRDAPDREAIMAAIKTSEARLAATRFKKVDKEKIEEGASEAPRPMRKLIGGVVTRSESQMSEKSKAGKAVMLAHEAEGLISQIEAVAASAGFAEDVDFTRMAEGLRSFHKTGGIDLDQCNAFHILVKDALLA